MAKYFERELIKTLSAEQSKTLLDIKRDTIDPSYPARKVTKETQRDIEELAQNILDAKRANRARILCFGTALIENGIGPLIKQFIKQGWLNHLACTGTAVCEDWEIAWRGKSNEDSSGMYTSGQFGNWTEPLVLINLAIIIGASRGLGLAEALGKFISDAYLDIPEQQELEASFTDTANPAQIAANADILLKLKKFGIRSGRFNFKFNYKKYSLLYSAYKAQIPFTVHPMFGLDNIHMSKFNSGAALGRSAERDFLSFVNSVNNLDGGIYLSVGSSVASPMIFEKALSMVQNVKLQNGPAMTGHKIAVVDLAESKWDWMHDGEPPEDRPEYYLRYCKSFSRAKAASMKYISLDNRDFFVTLYNTLTRMA